MPVHIKLSTTLRLAVPGYDPARGLTMDVPEGTDVAALIRRLGLERDAIKIIMIDGRHASLDSPLRGGERVALFPAVGGG